MSWFVGDLRFWNKQYDICDSELIEFCNENVGPTVDNDDNICFWIINIEYFKLIKYG
jgi:hypothetical protein